MKLFAPAKINLMLHVTGRRADGYHLLQSAMAFADAGDEITLEEAPAYSLRVDGPFAALVPHGDDNLVTRAVRTMEKKAGRAARCAITLVKNLPPASGLGGGSSDAAAVMRALNAFWGAPFTPDALDATGLSIGAELPVCLSARACWVEGAGERLFPFSLAPFDAVIAWPGEGVSTAAVFKAFSGDFSPAILRPDRIDPLWLRTQRNDLTQPAQSLLPSVASATQDLAKSRGCLLARMSGAGSCSFGLFENAAAAKETAAKIAAEHPSWWVKACRIA